MYVPKEQALEPDCDTLAMAIATAELKPITETSAKTPSLHSLFAFTTLTLLEEKKRNWGQREAVNLDLDPLLM
ncbi:hypothetical protein M0R45_030097 [Rubus argutus]|uniref:Uncharacterized protein n=1 Tax=Rubus argutus TaxID=59490 RepID=A0AAW1WAE7_RUBAR